MTNLRGYMLVNKTTDNTRNREVAVLYWNFYDKKWRRTPRWACTKTDLIRLKLNGFIPGRKWKLVATKKMFNVIAVARGINDQSI